MQIIFKADEATTKTLLKDAYKYQENSIEKLITTNKIAQNLMLMKSPRNTVIMIMMLITDGAIVENKSNKTYCQKTTISDIDSPVRHIEISLDQDNNNFFVASSEAYDTEQAIAWIGFSGCEEAFKKTLESRGLVVDVDSYVPMQ